MKRPYLLEHCESMRGFNVRYHIVLGILDAPKFLWIKSSITTSISLKMNVFLPTYKGKKYHGSTIPMNLIIDIVLSGCQPMSHIGKIKKICFEYNQLNNSISMRSFGRRQKTLSCVIYTVT